MSRGNEWKKVVSLRLGAVQLSLSCIFIVSALTIGTAQATISPRPFFETPFVMYVASEENMDSLSVLAWQKRYNLLDGPISICTRRYFDTSTMVGDFFVLDRTQNLVRFFGSALNLSGLEEGYYMAHYGEGRGAGTHQFDDPRAITISPNGPSCSRYVYVLDTGNNRVQKLHFAICNSIPDPPSLSHIQYIYDGQGEPGYGALNNPQDIDYCDLYQDSDADNDFLLIADTDNHRVLAMQPDGTVLWSVGGANPGNGPFEFSYPFAVTARKIDAVSNRAWIYVADRGNNRIVRFTQAHDWSLSAFRSVDLPSDLGAEPQDGMNGYLFSGLVDIDTDAHDYRTGIFVLDSRAGKVRQFDYHLEREVATYDSFSFSGALLYDLEMAYGELVVQSPYTDKSGAELFEVRATIENLSVSPSPFSPPLEWAMATMSTTGSGELNVWIENSVGAVVDSLVRGAVVSTSVEYAVWDGRDALDSLVVPGTYTIRAILDDEAWLFSDTASITVEVSMDSSIAVLDTGLDLGDPSFSPDGREMAYRKVVNGGTNLVRHELVSGQIDVLTVTESPPRRILQPAWSPDGETIAYVRVEDVPLYTPKSAIFAMDLDSLTVIVISDTSTNYDHTFVEETPTWVGNDLLSYTSGYVDRSFEQVDLASWLRSTIYNPPGTPYLRAHAWSPRTSRFVYASYYDVYLYDVESDYETQLTPDDPTGLQAVMSVDWSSGDRIAFTQFNSYANPDSQILQWRWDVFSKNSVNGSALPIAGLGSDVIGLYTGLAWSPDGTKIAFPVQASLGPDYDLIYADLVRGVDAFPLAMIITPTRDEKLSDEIAIVGTVGHNVSVSGTTISSLDDFYIQWGQGENPGEWSDYGMTRYYGCPGQSTGCPVDVDTVAVWNTGVVPSGVYTLRIVASDGLDSNIVYRRVIVSHQSLTAAADGSGDFTSIQDAIDAALSGDTILVKTGSYAEQLVMKEATYLFGKDLGVRLDGGDGNAVTIANHEYPCVLQNIEIVNPSPTSGSRGVFISNASPRILNCEIRGHNSNPAGGGAGVCITGLSYPSFVDCTIRDNRCSDGAGVKVRGLNTDNPAPEFIRCRFVSNESSQLDGGAVRLEYDTALDSSNTQPSFVDCEIDSNISRRGGAAVYLINCHSPVFVGCSFLGNEVNSAHAADGIIDGYQSGGVFSHCTFVGNVSFHDNTQDVFMLGPVSGISKPIKINRTIVAFNEGAAVYAPWANEYDVSNSDFFGNREADDYWLTSGQDNFNVDPSFCDQPNGDCTLYAFSSCSYALSPVGRVGAFGVGCVPDCAVTSFPDTSTMFPGDSIFFSCPQGDSAGMALRLSVDFEESQMTRALEPSEIFLEQFSYAPFSSFGAGLLTADSTADSASGFYTTVAHEFLGGCGTAAIAVNLNGELLAERPTVTVKSPDLDGDGDVHTTDLATFGLAFPSCRDSTNYNDCADYSADGCVSMADLSMWAPHWMHEYQPPLASVAAAQPPESGIRLQLSFMEVRASGTQHKLFVTVALDNLGAFDVLCFVLRNENNLLEYVGWQENRDFPALGVAVPIVRGGEKQLFLAAFPRSERRASVDAMGILEFNIRDNAELILTQQDLSLIVGEVLGADEVVRRLGAAGGAASIGQAPGYVDHLAQNYPNPFNPTTTIAYSIGQDSRVNLSIYNVRGQLVKTIVDGFQQARNYRVVWDGLGNQGAPVASGAYFYKLEAGQFRATKKLVLLK